VNAQVLVLEMVLVLKVSAIALQDGHILIVV